MSLSSRFRDAWARASEYLKIIHFVLREALSPTPAPAVPYPPGNSRLESLPDELILQILECLPFDDFYCVSQCSRRLSSLCQDRIFQDLQSAKKRLAKRSYSGCLKYSPKLNDDSILSHLGKRIQNIRYTTDGDKRLAATLRRDMFCEKCQCLRRHEGYATNNRWLRQRMHKCGWCKIYHGTALFSKELVPGTSNHACVAWTGAVRQCPHIELGWKSILNWRRRFEESCDRVRGGEPFLSCVECQYDSTSYESYIYHNRSKMVFKYYRLLPDAPTLLTGDHAVIEDYQEMVREFCKTAEYKYLCPHWSLDNPYMVAVLMRLVPMYWEYLADPSRDSNPRWARGFHNLSARVLTCKYCSCDVQLGLGRERTLGGRAHGNVRIVLKAKQRINIGFTMIQRELITVGSYKPSKDFLAHLDPASYDGAIIRGPTSEGFSWCKSADCATNRLGGRQTRILQDAWGQDLLFFRSNIRYDRRSV